MRDVRVSNLSLYHQGLTGDRRNLSFGTSLGPRIIVTHDVSHMRYHTMPLDPYNTQPFVTFYFKYRPAGTCPFQHNAHLGRVDERPVFATAVLRAQGISAPVPQTARSLEKALRRSRMQITAWKDRRALDKPDVKPIVLKRAAPEPEAAATKLVGGKENIEVSPPHAVMAWAERPPS